MQSSTYLEGAGDCGCAYMKIAYMEASRTDRALYSPYSMMFPRHGDRIIDIQDMGKIPKGDGITYCWTKFNTLTLPNPTIIDMSSSCGDKIKNLDYNTVTCNNRQFKGWVTSLALQIPVDLCGAMSHTEIVTRDRVRLAFSHQALARMPQEMWAGAFSPVKEDCEYVAIDKYAGAVIDLTTTGFTREAFRQIQQYYAARMLSTRNLIVYLSQTAFNQLMASYDAASVSRCYCVNSAGLTEGEGLMYDPETMIKYTMVVDSILDKASGHAQWMLALNSDFVRYTYGSSLFSASIFNNRLPNSCSTYTNLSGYSDLFNVVERYNCDAVGKMSGEFVQYLMLNSFAKLDPRGVLLIKGKV